MADNYQIKLGDKIYSNLNISKNEFGLVRNYNQVYVNANNMNLTDLLQFPYDPNRKQFYIGKVKAQADSSTGDGAITEQNVYVPIVTGSGTTSGGGSIVEDNDVQVIVQGTGIIVNSTNVTRPVVSVNTSVIATRQFVLDTVQQMGGTGGGGDITINGITSLVAGTGINVDDTDSSNPVISVNTSTIATKEYVREQIKSNGTTGGSSTGETQINLDNPDYAALLELLNVLEVHYDDEPLTSFFSSTSETGSIHQSTGFRIKWVLTSGETEYVANCIRWKNITTNGNRFNGSIYLKVLEYQPSEFNELGYAQIDETILTVSSNSINQKENNEEGEWYEWYFPKNISFKPNHVYVIIPHHDKTFEKVTETTAKMCIFGTSDTNAATNNVTGIWTGNRSTEVNVIQNPIIQFCYKNPTTILMKR